MGFGTAGSSHNFRNCALPGCPNVTGFPQYMSFSSWTTLLNFLHPNVGKRLRDLPYWWRLEEGSHVTIQEHNFRIYSRWYRTPSIVHRIFTNTLDCFWCCGVDEGTMLHIWWSCRFSNLTRRQYMALSQKWQHTHLLSQCPSTFSTTQIQ